MKMKTNLMKHLFAAALLAVCTDSAWAQNLDALPALAGADVSLANDKIVIMDASATSPKARTITFAELLNVPSMFSTKENALGNPAGNGYVLSSTTGGTRSWVAMTSDLTSGPVTSSGGVSAIADAALSIAKTNGLQAAIDGKATTAQGALADSALQAASIGGVRVLHKYSAPEWFLPAANTNLARGDAAEAAFADSDTGEDSTVDFFPGEYEIDKLYDGNLIGGAPVTFGLKTRMTVRLNGARLYRPAITTVAQNALVVGRWYIITGGAGGTADWTSVGSSSNNGGFKFAATQTAVTGGGTGVVIPVPMAMFGVAYSTGTVSSIDWSLIGPGIIEGDAATTALGSNLYGYQDQHGVHIIASRRWRIDGISFLKHRGSGIYLNTPTWANETSYTAKISTGHVTNCNFDLGQAGMTAYPQNEYAQFSNCTFNQNITGVDLYAGNTMFSNCVASGNSTDGVILRNGTNDGHGCWIGGHITHNLGKGIYAEASMDYGFPFIGVTIGGSATVNTIESRGGGLNFSGCYLDCLFKAGATPTGLNTVQNCFFPQADIANPVTVLADMNTAERAQWRFLDNHTLTGRWGGDNNVTANVTLVAGTKAVALTSITANSLVTLTRKTAGGTLGGGGYTYTLNAGTGFTINSVDTAGSLSTGDTSVITYTVSEP